MRAVVFGGSGFIGTHLTRALVREGAEVLVADLVPPADPPEGVRFEQTDVRNPIRISRDEPYDAVYNLAAVHRTPGHEPHEYYETNLGGATNITEWCAAGGERYIFFTSSISIYGPVETPTVETSAPTPNSDYGRSKLEAERIHREWREAGDGRRLFVVRPGAIFGAGEGGNFTRLAESLRTRRFMYPGRNDVIKACGYVGDLVAARKFVESLPDDELTFNFAYPDAYTSREVCEAFNNVAGLPLPRNLPAPLIQLAVTTLGTGVLGRRGSHIGERIVKLVNSTYIVPQVLIDRGFTWPTDLERGLRSWLDDAPAGRFI
jgi:nucleoside-diphosphate-sugar epimerase